MHGSLTNNTCSTMCSIPSLCKGHLQCHLGKRELSGVHSHLYILQEGVCRGGDGGEMKGRERRKDKYCTAPLTHTVLQSFNPLAI